MVSDITVIARRIVELSSNAGAFPNLTSLSDIDREYVKVLLKSAPTLARCVIEMDTRVHQLRATIMESIEMEQEEQA